MVLEGIDYRDDKIGSIATQPIAIVGASCRLPGAPDLAALKELLNNGRDAVTEIPDDRWAKPLYFHPYPGQRGRSYTFAAGVLNNVYGFDAGFFGISPREAAQMDPQQRLCLELAFEAFEDAGLDSRSLAGEAVGVYVGGSSWDYQSLHNGDVASADAYSMTGATLCSLSNRVSYAFDLRGPSFTVDTACSSSLVALHLACEALRHGQIRAALVGGVNLLLAPQSFVGFSRASMLSPQGRCHAFDARANGYVRSEGGGFVLLMRQGDAATEGRRARALIRGTGTNSDGRTTGFSQPNRVAQADMLRGIYDRFDIDPNELTYIEAHGTGTPVGDPIEAAALGEVLGTRRRESLPMGSVKTNLGHLEAASGMAGLMKALLIIDDRQLPRSLHCETPNPAIPLDELNLRLLPQGEAVAGTGPITIGVNSFGFGGTNAHAVLSSAPEPATPHRDVAAQPPMLLLSARSASALNEQAAAWSDEIAIRGDAGLPDLLAGAARFREQHTHRLAIIAPDAEAYQRGLADFIAGRERSTVIRGEAVGNDQVAFVYAGNGSQWAGMAAQAIQLNPAFRAFIGEASDALQPLLGWSVADRLTAAPDAERLRLTEEAQPQLFAIQYAITNILRQLGVTPSAHLGHSVGEIAAAWAAGALTLEDAARVVAARSRHQGGMAGEGGMAVVVATADEVDAGMAAIGATGLAVAAHNTERSLTVAGPVRELRALQDYAAAHRWTFELLDLPYAFHSPLMEPIRAPLLADLDGLVARPTHSTFVSTVTGSILPGARLGADYWWRNVREPVNFAGGVERLMESGIRIFVEIGPQPILQGYLNKIVATDGVRGRVLPSLVRRPMPADPLLVCAARCHVAGHSIAETVGGTGDAALEGLPRYPWQREDLRVERTPEATDQLNPAQTHPLLGFQSSEEGREWTSDLSAARLPWLEDHTVSRTPVLPAAAFIEIALAVARTTAAPGATLELRDLDIGSPLVLPPGATQTLRSSLGADGKLTLASRQRLADTSWATHARCRVSASGSDTPLPWSGSEPTGVQRTIGAAELYALTDRLGLHYGPAFQTVTAVDLLGPRDATVHLRQTVPAGPNQIVHPSLLDGAFQGLVGLAASLLRLDEEAGGVLPWRFERVRSFRPGAATGAKLHVRHVGPRAICADVLVHDTDGDALLELNGCWFVRTNAAPVRNPASHCLHQISVATANDSLRAPVLPTIDAQVPGLADVYISAAIQEALLAHGDIPAGYPDALSWLREDGLLDASGLQSELGGIRADDLLGAIAFEYPTAVADAALLSLAAHRFKLGLSGDTPSGTLPPALLDQMLTASPTASSGLHAIRAAVLATIAGRSGLRILEIGAGRGTLATDLLPALAETPPADYCVLASPDELPVLRETMLHLPAARTVARPATDAALAGPFDLIVGINALTLLARAERESLLTTLPGLLAPGGTTLLLEPQPNRLWHFLPVPDAADQPAQPRIGTDWIAILGAAGLTAPTATSVPGLHWTSTLLTACGAPIAAARGAGPGRLLLVAAPGDAAADALASLLDTRRTVPADLPALDGLSGLIVMPPPTLSESDAPLWLTGLVRAALAASEPALPLWLVLHGDHDDTGSVDPGAAALAAACRVVANEVPTVTCRILTVANDMSVAEAAPLVAAEIGTPTAETDIVLSLAGRRVTRFRPGLPAGDDPSQDSARRLVVSRPGRLDSLQFESFTPAAPGPGQVALEVRAAGLNFRDVMWAMGLLPDEALLHGFAGPGLGFECAGIVTAVGPDVEGFAPGDRVMAVASTCLATHAVTAAFATLKMPDGMSFADGATIPVAYLTVAYALGYLGHLRAGERVLIHGGAGAVGLAAIQYARNRGAVIFATAGSEAKRALLRSLGVDHVLDSRSLSFADDVLAATDREGVDLVLNSLDGEAMERSLGLLKPFGRFLELGKRDVYGNTSIGLRPMRHNISYHLIDVDQLAAQRPAVASEVLQEVAALLMDGRVRPLPRREMPLAQAAEAFRLMQAAGHIGKLVLVPGDAALPVPQAPATFTARADATYVVVGGLGGFGLETARWLARHGARRLALLGRRGVRTPGATDALAALATDGVDARAFTCDAADEVSLETALTAIRCDLGPIAGIVHAAMHLEDGLIASLDVAKFERSLRAKWVAAELLDRLTRDDDLHLFLLFSSVTTVLGNPGQANYVAANAALEAIARRRHRAGLPALAVGWGPIADAGILTRQAGVAEELERRMGAAPMTAAEALDGLPRLLQSGLPVVTYAPMDWNSAKQLLTALQAPAFTWLAQYRENAAPAVDIRAMLAGHDDAEAESLILGLLVEEMASVMRLPADRVDPARPLAEIGMDSLMAVELRLGMEARFGMSLPLFALSDTTTPLSLAGVLARSVRGDRQEAPPPTALEDVLRRHDADQAELKVAE